MAATKTVSKVRVFPNLNCLIEVGLYKVAGRKLNKHKEDNLTSDVGMPWRSSVKARM